MSSWRGKRKDDGDHRRHDAAAHDPESHAPPSKKPSKPIAAAAAAADSDDDSNDIVVCEISKNRRVSVRNWNGRIWVDIREFYIKDGKQLPGKKGISLSVEQWNILRDHVDEIDKAFAEYS